LRSASNLGLNGPAQEDPIKGVQCVRLEIAPGTTVDLCNVHLPAVHVDNGLLKTLGSAHFTASSRRPSGRVMSSDWHPAPRL
jgi:hypothetical protein